MRFHCTDKQTLHTDRHTLYISRHTNPTTSKVVVAIAGMILPAINLLCIENNRTSNVQHFHGTPLKQNKINYIGPNSQSSEKEFPKHVTLPDVYQPV